MSCRSNTRTALALAALAASCALSGCSDIYFDRRETIAPSAGDAKQVNQVTMMVDPWPPYSARRNIAFNGEVMQRAVERYREGYVIPPVNATTSSAAYARAQAVQAQAQRANTPPPPPAAGAAPSPWAGPQKAQTTAQSSSQAQP
jgi:hypothetical protein